MNERIKELSAIAKNLTTDEAIHLSRIHNRTLSLDELGEIHDQKFAELLVRECADVIQKEVSMKYKDGGETEEFMGGHYAGSVLARVKIRQHFGVSE